MISGWIMKGLLVIYGIIMIAALVEKRWYLALYWFAAGLLMISILKGMK